MKRHRIAHTCAQCGASFEAKASKPRVFCSVACRGIARRTEAFACPRPCKECGATFTPSPSNGRALYCSQSCVWKATKGPEFNAKIAKEYAPARAEKVRGSGTRGYVKRNGRHEHRQVAERKIGRALGPGEVVHHIDGDKHNNEPGNLAVMTQAEHMREHGLGIPGLPPPWQRSGR